jgi:hypothetical protein
VTDSVIFPLKRDEVIHRYCKVCHGFPATEQDSVTTNDLTARDIGNASLICTSDEHIVLYSRDTVIVSNGEAPRK